MMPHGAPTIVFSAIWHNRASSSPASSKVSSAATARIVATSIAADELTPFPSGTLRIDQNPQAAGQFRLRFAEQC